MPKEEPAVTIETVSDADEQARASVQRQRFDRNAAWLQAHAHEVYPRCRGKCLCIAGEELFVADSPQAAVALAAAAHPEDDGRFVYYVPRENVARVYADRR